MSKMPNFWNFFNLTSQPTIPSLYWDSYSYEERIKKICDKIWSILNYLKLVMEDLNEFDDRLAVLEELYNTLETRVTEVESLITKLQTDVSNIQAQVNIIMSSLPGLIQSILKTFVDSDEFTNKIISIINDNVDLSSKLDKPEGSNPGDIVTFGNDNTIQDSYCSILHGGFTNDIKYSYSIPDAYTISNFVINHNTNIDEIFNYHIGFAKNYDGTSDNPSQLGNWTITINNVTYSSSSIIQMYNNNDNSSRTQMGLFFDSNWNPVILAREYTMINPNTAIPYGWTEWHQITYQYILCDNDSDAKTKSLANPNIIYYTTED